MKSKTLTLTFTLAALLVLPLGLAAQAQDSSPTNSRSHTEIYLPTITPSVLTHHELQDRGFAIRNARPDYVSNDLKGGDKEDVECGPTIAGDVFDERPIYDFKYSDKQEDPAMASIRVFANQGPMGYRGWIRNDVKPFEIWIAVNKKDGSHELGDIREPDFTIGQYLWTLARRDGNPPDSAKEKAIREEVARRLKINLQPEDVIILYGFKVKGTGFTLYAQPGFKS